MSTHNDNSMSPALAPIPRNVAAYVGGTNSALRSYVLWKDGNMIIIQAPAFEWVLSLFNNPRAANDNVKQNEYILKYYHGLEIIHALIDSIEFGKTNWAYLVQNEKTGESRIIQKQKTFPKITIPTWAPLIEESDITFTTWWGCENRLGYWKGREVEVFMGWDGGYWKGELEYIMKAYQCLQGLDLTFEVLAHIVRDGSVIGIVTESPVGRMLQYCDRSILYDAVARVEQRNLIHMGPTPLNLLICDGKVRFINLAAIRYYEPHQKAEFQALAEVRHWKTLEGVFENMDTTFTYIPHTWRRRPQNLHILPKFPSPEKPLRVQLTLNLRYQESPLDMRKINKERRRKLEHRSLRLSEDKPAVESAEPFNLALVVPEKPYSSLIHSSKPKVQNIYQPYDPQKSTSRKLLLG